MGYTPGPWEVKKVRKVPFNGTEFITTIIRSNSTNEIIVRGSISDDDARLIAAAPDLLEALKAVVHEIAIDEHVSNGMIAALDLAEAAVLKAEG